MNQLLLNDTQHQEEQQGHKQASTCKISNPRRDEDGRVQVFCVGLFISFPLIGWTCSVHSVNDVNIIWF